MVVSWCSIGIDQVDYICEISLHYALNLFWSSYYNLETSILLKVLLKLAKSSKTPCIHGSLVLSWFCPSESCLRRWIPCVSTNFLGVSILKEDNCSPIRHPRSPRHCLGHPPFPCPTAWVVGQRSGAPVPFVFLLVRIGVIISLWFDSLTVLTRWLRAMMCLNKVSSISPTSMCPTQRRWRASMGNCC